MQHKMITTYATISKMQQTTSTKQPKNETTAKTTNKTNQAAHIL